MSELLNLFDYEAAAGAVLGPAAYGYYASGAMDEITLRDNRAAYDRLRLRPRVLVDVSRRELAVSVLGRPVAFPVLIAPTALHGLAHPDAEVATARAAALARTAFVLSTLSNASLEAVREASSGRLWFQLYVYRDRGFTRALVERAESAGYEALVLTADTPVLGRREQDVRNVFHLPPGLALGNLLPAGHTALPAPIGDSGVAAHFGHFMDPSLSWRDVEWLRSITRLPILVKGVCRADDACRAQEAGAAGVIVSNHGGRQLDTARAAIDSLAEVAGSVGGEMEILLDGGIRRGTDVLKALALGARAVLVGRPILWGLAVAGEAGVARVLQILREEIDLALTLAGCPDAANVPRDIVVQ